MAVVPHWFASLLLAGALLPSAQAAEPDLALRDFVLFSHRKITDDLVQGKGVYLDTLLTRLAACGARKATLDWLRQLAIDTADTSEFADRIARYCPAPSDVAAAAPPARLPAQQAWEPQWRALLHYRPAGSGRWRSEADLPAFFLSREGKTSPQAELQANLDAIKTDATYACTFPARYTWLVRQFGLTVHAQPDGHCPELSAWLARFPGQRISINFASSYLESPSSMFGHTFLKVYQHASDELLSPTINYAARTDDRVSELAFVRKGVFGGFPGVADELPFYRRLRTYTEDEGRDIWEYELDLQPAELRMLLLHLWEVRSGVFDYYFFDENCAYRTLALLDVARPGVGQLDQYGAVTAPIDTIRTLQQNGMAGKQTLWPAFPKLVRRHEVELGRDDARLAAQLAAGEQDPAALAGSNPQRQASVLQLAYEYLSVRINRDQADRETRKQTMNAILRARLALGVPASLASSVPAHRPESGHDGSSLLIGRYQRGTVLAWAGFEHTLTDRLAGFEANAEVTVLRPEIRIDDGQGVRLERVDWLSIQSTLPGSSLFPRSAWKLQLATARRDFADGRHVTTSLGYSLGRAWSLGDAVLAVLPGVSVEAGPSMEHKAAAAGTLAVALTRQSSLWSGQLELNMEKLLLGQQLYRSSARVRSSIVLSRNAALELSARRDFRPRASSEVGLALKVNFRPLAFMPQR